MPIVSTEIKAYRSAVVSNTVANGGVISSVEVVDGASANLFQNASSMELANGAVHYRKMFMKVANQQNLTLLNPRLWMDSNTVGEDRVVFFPGTQRNTQAAISGFEGVYGMGVLAVGAAAGAQTLSVEVEDGGVPIFVQNRMVRISNKLTPEAAGDEFWVVVDQEPSVAGSVVTLHINTPLPTTFLSGSKVSSVYEAADVQATLTAPSKTSAAGTLNATWADKAYVNGVGAIEQSWTLTFTSATAYSIVGDILGNIGAGNVTSGAAPVNPAFGVPYFTLLSTLFGGTFAIGDTVTFSTSPSAVPVWLRRTIPAGTVAVSNNHVDLYMDGETA